LLILLGLTELTLETLELFYFDNISAEDVRLSLLPRVKQTYKSLLFISKTTSMDIFVWLCVPSKPSSQPIWLKPSSLNLA